MSDALPKPPGRDTERVTLEDVIEGTILNMHTIKEVMDTTVTGMRALGARIDEVSALLRDTVVAVVDAHRVLCGRVAAAEAAIRRADEQLTYLVSEWERVNGMKRPPAKPMGRA